MGKKAQAATEYLIILAVVIIIALIVIGVMGGIPGLGGAGKSRVSESYWAGQIPGVDSYAVAADGTYKFTVRNNARNSITIIELNVSSGEYGTTTPASTTIASGGTTTISSAVAIDLADRCTAGQSYAYVTSIKYTDGATGATNIINGDGGIIKLEGTCAVST